ncbi:MAG: HAMP domain-containing histidine kinase [Elusimicrobia bacterium]|nr:HAMP domain-containing histidine kinase [Elusimicrobiota bacterium]
MTTDAPASPAVLEAWTALFEELSDGVCVSDSDFRILYLNRAARDIMRLDERPRRGVTICELASVALPTAQIGRCAAKCPLREEPRLDASTVRIDGVRIRCLATPRALGNLHLTLFEDTRAEDELRRHQEDWRDMVAHDLRTPLTPILATLILLLENPGLGASDRRLVEISIGSARRMLDLLTLYLDVAKLSAGLMPVRLERVPVERLAREAAEEHAALIRQKRQSLRFGVPESLQAKADPDLLSRVLENLLSNAVKFAPEDGTIEIVGERSGDLVRVSVRDSGPGIRPEAQERLFDRFYQAEARRQGRTQGTGLGLAFCREAVEAMGGRIHVHSELGSGSEFTVVLPRPD